MQTLPFDTKRENTPLHDLVTKAASDESNMGEFINMWQVVVDNVVFWWCQKYDLTMPTIIHPDYKTYQRDALYYLRSEIPNTGSACLLFSLQLPEGLAKFVKEMIWVEDVFVKKVFVDPS